MLHTYFLKNSVRSVLFIVIGCLVLGHTLQQQGSIWGITPLSITCKGSTLFSVLMLQSWFPVSFNENFSHSIYIVWCYSICLSNWIFNDCLFVDNLYILKSSLTYFFYPYLLTYLLFYYLKCSFFSTIKSKINKLGYF